MSTSRTRIARFTASAALVVGLGALGAGPAHAIWTSPTAVTFASEDSVTLGEDQIDKARSAEDGAVDPAPDFWF